MLPEPPAMLPMVMEMPAMIRVSYRSVDRFSETRSYKTIAAARRYAVKQVGEHPEFGSGYAVSGDGVGVVRVRGCTLRELFATAEKPAPDAPMSPKDLRRALLDARKPSTAPGAVDLIEALRSARSAPAAPTSTDEEPQT